MTAKNYPPNLMSRREKTRREERCQLCRKKTPLKDQYTVENDLENLTVKKRKNADAKASAKKSHYCGDCADKRVSQKAAWMRATYGEANGSKAKAETKPAKKATGRGAPKAAKKTAAKPKPKARKSSNGAKAKAAKKVAGPKARKAQKAAATTSTSTEEDPF